MKKLLKVLIFNLFIFSSIILLAQPPDPDPDPGGGGGIELGGSAPVGSGIFLLLSLGVAYGVKKVYIINKKDTRA